MYVYNSVLGDYAIVKNERRQSSLDDEESVISSEGIEDIDAARLPQFRQSIMADVKNVGSSGIVAKSVPIMHSEVTIVTYRITFK